MTVPLALVALLACACAGVYVFVAAFVCIDALKKESIWTRHAWLVFPFAFLCLAIPVIGYYLEHWWSKWAPK